MDRGYTATCGDRDLQADDCLGVHGGGGRRAARLAGHRGQLRDERSHGHSGDQYLVGGPAIRRARTED